MSKAYEAVELAQRVGNREAYLKAMKNWQLEVHKAQSRKRKS